MKKIPEMSPTTRTVAVLLVGVVLGVGGLALYQSLVKGDLAFARSGTMVVKPDRDGDPSGQNPQAPAVRPFGWTAPDPWFDDDWFGSPFDSDWDPFVEIQRMQERMDKMFQHMMNRFSGFSGVTGGGSSAALSMPFSPSMDLREEGDRYVVEFDLPGADKSDIEVKVEGQVLSVSGKSRQTYEEKDSNGNVIRQERRAGAFQRAVTLPGPVDPEGVEARYEDGVLTVTLPKAGVPSDNRRIEVK